MKKSPVFFTPAKEAEGAEALAEKSRMLAVKSRILDIIEKDDYVGLKLYFGEEGNTGFIKPPVVKEILNLCRDRTANVSMVETNTIYIGARSNAISHLRLAHEHGFGYERMGAPIIIADGTTGRNYTNVAINKKHIKNAKIASGITDFECIIGLAHFTGHCQTGFGAAIKNIGMGCAARAGKLEQHSTVLPEITKQKCTGCALCLRRCPADAICINEKKAVIDMTKCIGCGECTVACRAGAIEIKWNESARNLQEKMAEYALAALLGRKKAFMNFLIKITKDCDCMAKDDPAIAPDIGILASSDPVAIDKAAIDLLIKESGYDRIKDGYPEIDWNVQLEHGAEIGLGRVDYELITVR